LTFAAEAAKSNITRLVFILMAGKMGREYPINLVTENKNKTKKLGAPWSDRQPVSAKESVSR
jgi:hypothetical protein